MEYRKLGNTGMNVSVLGFGASSLGGVFHEVNLDECIETVRVAFDGGINFIDVSPAYGETRAETVLGKALAGIPRGQYYLATKIGAYSEAKGEYDYSAARTECSLHELNDNSLATLIPYLTAKGVGIINASPTGMGLLTPRRAPDWHPASKTIIEGCRRVVDYCESKSINIVKLAIQYSCSHPYIATTLVSTSRPQNIRDNIAHVEESMDQRLLAEVLALLEPIHNFNFTRGRPEHRDPLLGS
jgi:aryl-alcohol dehydrogenase-like predicted oxidoreductase